MKNRFEYVAVTGWLTVVLRKIVGLPFTSTTRTRHKSTIFSFVDMFSLDLKEYAKLTSLASSMCGVPKIRISTKKITVPVLSSVLHKILCNILNYRKKVVKRIEYVVVILEFSRIFHLRSADAEVARPSKIT